MNNLPAPANIGELHVLDRFTDGRTEFRAAALSGDGALALAGNILPVRLYDTKSCTLIRKFEGQYGLVYDVAFSGDSQLAISNSCSPIKSKGTRLYEVCSGRCIREFPAGGVALNADGTRFLRCQYHATGPELCDSSNGEVIQSIAGPGRLLKAAATPDLRAVVTAHEFIQSIYMWNLESGALMTELKVGESDHYPALAISADARSVIAGMGSDLVFWNVEENTGAPIKKPYHGGGAIGSDDIERVAVSANGLLALTGGGGWLCLWSVPDKRVIGKLIKSARADDWSSVALSGDGRIALAGASWRTDYPEYDSVALWYLD